jgi:hypothetical protein
VSEALESLKAPAETHSADAGDIVSLPLPPTSGPYIEPPLSGPVPAVPAAPAAPVEIVEEPPLRMPEPAADYV